MFRAAVLVAVVAMATGCGQTEAGQPAAGDAQRTGGSTSTGSSSSTPPLAPPVRNQRDARNVAACDGLTPQQVAQLGLDPGTRHEVPLQPPLSPGCSWAATDASWGLVFGFDTNRNGLSETYLRRGNYQHFQPREIGGYPAVDAQTSYNPQDCYTFVGIADNQQLSINVDNRPTGGRTVPPACERLDQVVTMIIGNLPPLK